jgi:TRAP-type transport system periplasmic protein
MRRFLASMVVASIFCLCLDLVPSSAPAQQQIYELKASIFTPPSNPLNRAMEKWAEALKERSNGRLIIKIFAASQMGPPPRQFDLARTGVADFSIVLHGLTPGRFPLTELSHLPGVLTTGYVSSLALSEVGSEALLADHPGVKILNVLPIIPMPIISKDEIRTANDLRGKRIRAAGSVQSDVLQALGAVPTLVQPGDMNDALSKGMIEGASVGYSGIASYRLEDAAKFLIEGDLGGVTFATIMNKGAYDRLPPDLQKLIDEDSGAAGAKRFKILYEDEVNYRDDFVKRGLKLSKLTDDGPLQTASERIRAQAIKNAESKGLAAQEFLTRLKETLVKFQNEKMN